MTGDMSAAAATLLKEIAAIAHNADIEIRMSFLPKSKRGEAYACRTGVGIGWWRFGAN
jgi:hypothetical protein